MFKLQTNIGSAWPARVEFAATAYFAFFASIRSKSICSWCNPNMIALWKSKLEHLYTLALPGPLVLCTNLQAHIPVDAGVLIFVSRSWLSGGECSLSRRCWWWVSEQILEENPPCLSCTNQGMYIYLQLIWKPIFLLSTQLILYGWVCCNWGLLAIWV